MWKYYRIENKEKKENNENNIEEILQFLEKDRNFCGVKPKTFDRGPPWHRNSLWIAKIYWIGAEFQKHSMQIDNENRKTVRKLSRHKFSLKQIFFTKILIPMHFKDHQAIFCLDPAV